MLALITTLIAVLLLFFLYYLGPKLEQEITQLWSQLNQQVAHMQILSGQNFVDRFVQQEFSLQSGIATHVSAYIGSFATSAVTAAISGFIVIVTALYFAISPSLYVNGIVRLFPLPYRPRARAVMLALGRTLQWWSVGQMIDMITVGLLSGLGMALLGLPLAFALAVLAGLLTFIPYFGAIIAAIPAMIVALTIGWQTSLWVAVIFLVSHTVEGYVVGPLVQRHTVRLPPALTILSMTILGTISARSALSWARRWRLPGSSPFARCMSEMCWVMTKSRCCRSRHGSERA